MCLAQSEQKDNTQNCAISTVEELEPEASVVRGKQWLDICKRLRKK
jgi:hypothetical protein